MRAVLVSILCFSFAVSETLKAAPQNDDAQLCVDDETMYAKTRVLVLAHMDTIAFFIASVIHSIHSIRGYPPSGFLSGVCTYAYYNCDTQRQRLQLSQYTKNEYDAEDFIWKTNSAVAAVSLSIALIGFEVGPVPAVINLTILSAIFFKYPDIDVIVDSIIKGFELAKVPEKAS